MTPRQADFGWSYPPGCNSVPDDERDFEWENEMIAEGVKQTVQEIQTERERIQEIERLYEQLKERVDDIHQELKELEQRVNGFDNPAH